jgi:hypothetical protein
MKKTMPERYRVKMGAVAFEISNTTSGFFKIPHPKIANYYFEVILSSPGDWERVSVMLSSPKRKVERKPTWDEMCLVKSLFFEEAETVVQFHHGIESKPGNEPLYCLSLWRSTNGEYPQPIPIF